MTKNAAKDPTPGRPADSRPLISDYGIIGDCHTAALISRQGSIDWLCLPRFDSASSFGKLVGSEQGGTFELAPPDGNHVTRYYLENSLVLVTSWTAGGAKADVIDLLVSDADDSDGPHGRSDERQLLRIVHGRRGHMDFRVKIMPRFDYGQVHPWLRREGSGRWALIAGDDGLIVSGDTEMETNDERDQLTAEFSVRADEQIRFSLVFRRPELIELDATVADRPAEIDDSLKRTLAGWREWCEHLGGEDTEGTEARAVGRSATVLRALTYAPTGAIVAAPTTSLPETEGGDRNWDYRYSWVRDSTFASRTLAEVGAEQGANAFRRFVERSTAGRAEDLQVLYGVGGERRLSEHVMENLDGYRSSTPVRIGNAASEQVQLDTIGEVVNLSWRWHRRGHSPDDDHWRFLVSLVDAAAERWPESDSGIWEWRGEPENFVHSKALCWSALDRGLDLAEECMREAPIERWSKARDEIREAVEANGYDKDRGVFVQSFEHSGLDALLLLLPSIHFLAWDDDRMLRTADAIAEELDAGDGLLYRYRRPDGLEGSEGAFIACSFWLTECLARQRRIDRAREAFNAALATANDLGLFSEQWDPERHRMLGNFPQGLSHLAHIAASIALEEAADG